MKACLVLCLTDRALSRVKNVGGMYADSFFSKVVADLHLIDIRSWQDPRVPLALVDCPVFLGV